MSPSHTHEAGAQAPTQLTLLIPLLFLTLDTGSIPTAKPRCTPAFPGPSSTQSQMEIGHTGLAQLRPTVRSPDPQGNVFPPYLPAFQASCQFTHTHLYSEGLLEPQTEV